MHSATSSHCVARWLPTRTNTNLRTIPSKFRSHPLLQRQFFGRPCFSSTAGERLRVAVVGGGAAGLSSALHLAPLVEAGLVASPIDVFDAEPVPTTTAFARKAGGRDIGVGIWSTALNPFLQSDRESHALVYREMTERGSWIGDVGYRIAPSGKWLMKSHLPVSPEESAESGMPSLLFLREKDMLTSLQKAVHWEEQRGMIRVHRDGIKTRVTGLHEQSPFPWSTQLMFNKNYPDKETDETFSVSERDYHLVLAADGTHSMIRREYGAHEWVTGRSSLASPIDLPSENDSLSARTSSSWNEAVRLKGSDLQDRKYTVFRGNSRLLDAQVSDDGATSISFQTWGLNRSMRFATVPMHYPGARNQREERQVWFITSDNDQITMAKDPVVRKEMLLRDFEDWHDPILRIVEATPAEEILMERAVAHRHCMGPILNFNRLVNQKTGRRPPNSGQGPCVVFTGDAYMTVDPILAQGFTLAMEGAAVLRHSVEQSCKVSSSYQDLSFDPHTLRQEIQSRHDARMDRLVCLLRATELVQALGQPTGGTLSGFANTKILRPLTRVTPNFVKAPIFDRVLKYSLGL